MEALPFPTPWLWRGFAWYTERYLARHFHAVRLLGAAPEIPAGAPLVVYLNHPSWWDPLLCLLLSERCFPGRTGYAPIEAAMLERYRFMQRLGFFPVEQGSRRGAAAFLRQSEVVLARPGSALWLTPQGRFADARERPVRLARGLAHLARRQPGALFVPLALELGYWTERTPEAFAHFGAPVPPGEDLARRLAETQDALAAAVQARSPEPFISLLRGAAGEGGLYERWRRVRARWRGERFLQEHAPSSPPDFRS